MSIPKCDTHRYTKGDSYFTVEDRLSYVYWVHSLTDIEAISMDIDMLTDSLFSKEYWVDNYEHFSEGTSDLRGSRLCLKRIYTPQCHDAPSPSEGCSGCLLEGSSTGLYDCLRYDSNGLEELITTLMWGGPFKDRLVQRKDDLDKLTRLYIGKVRGLLRDKGINL